MDSTLTNLCKQLRVSGAYAYVQDHPPDIQTPFIDFRLES